MAKTRICPAASLHKREFTTQRSSQPHSNEQSMIKTCSAETDKDGRGPSLVWDIAWLKERVTKMLLWKIIEPFIPEWPEPAGANRSTDYVVGMTLHCFILSIFVLSVAAARAMMFLFRFACYISLHYAIYKGDVIPISEDSVEPVTIEQVREATIFDSSGLKIILVQSTPATQNRPLRPTSTNRTMTTTSRPRNCNSDSSQDLSTIFSFSSK